MLALLIALCSPVAEAAEIEVSGVPPVNFVYVDGKRQVPTGTGPITKKRLDAGEHTVTVQTALGKVLAEFSITLEADEGARVRYTKKSLSLFTKYAVDPPREGGALGLGGGKSDGAADAITITKKGGAAHYLWLDGEPQGRVKGKGLELSVGEGDHEVWVASDEGGTWTVCHGLASMGGTVGLSNKGCEGLADGEASTTFARGATPTYKQAGGFAGYVSIDGGKAVRAGAGLRTLNLGPGAHTFVLSAEPAAVNIYAQHTFELGLGDSPGLSCSTAGCLGFKEAPAPFTVVSVELPASDAGGGDAGSGGTSGGSGGDYCCVNSAYYECPNAKEAYDCTGAFMTCMLDCDIMDPDCIGICDEEHPIDPSGCDRTPSRDGECD